VLAGTFVAMAALARLRGDDAQAAAEAAVAEQGVAPEVLAARGVNFRESALELCLPLAIALALAALATLNLAGEGIGRTLSFVFQPLLLVAGGFVTGSQVFAVRDIESAFRRSGDPTLQAIDVNRLVDAALSAFPRGFRGLVVARFLLVTLGSAAVIVVLALG
jgi:hypothetical protein